MAKTGKRRQKAERSKTQLRTSVKSAGRPDRKQKTKAPSGIRLPRGLNETKAEVRSKTVSVGGATGLNAKRSREVPKQEEEIPTAGKRHRPIKVSWGEANSETVLNLPEIHFRRMSCPS